MKEPGEWRAGDVVQLVGGQTVLLYTDHEGCLANIVLDPKGAKQGLYQGDRLLRFLDSHHGCVLFNLPDLTHE